MESDYNIGQYISSSDMKQTSRSFKSLFSCSFISEMWVRTQRGRAKHVLNNDGVWRAVLCIIISKLLKSPWTYHSILFVEEESEAGEVRRTSGYLELICIFLIPSLLLHSGSPLEDSFATVVRLCLLPYS